MTRRSALSVFPTVRALFSQVFERPFRAAPPRDDWRSHCNAASDEPHPGAAAF